MKKALFTLAIVALAGSAAPLSEPTMVSAADGEDMEFTPDSSAIASSDVYWDLYSMCRDAWLVNHRDATEFNPYYLTPKYGEVHNDSEVASCLGIVPDGSDVYVYMWFDTASTGWDGESPKFTYSNDTSVGSDGYYNSAAATKTGVLVSKYGKSETGSSNWLAKYKLEGISGTGSIKRVSVLSIEIPTAAGKTTIELSSDTQWKGDEVDSSDFDFYHAQDNYVTISRKKVAMMLEPALNGPGAPGTGLTHGIYTASKPQEVYNYSDHYDPNCVVQGVAAESNSSFMDDVPEEYAGTFSKYYENTYCFFDFGPYYVNGVEQTIPIANIESITYSFNRLTYKYQSSNFHRLGINWNKMVPICYARLYNKPVCEESLRNGAKYYSESVAFLEKKIENGNSVRNVVSDGFKFLFWKLNESQSDLDLIVDCTDEDSWYNQSFDGNKENLANFILNNRWDYPYAFLIDSTERTGENGPKDDGGFLTGYDWNTTSTCHEVQDVVILRIKFRDMQNTSFDLKALDSTIDTESIYVPSTSGKDFQLNVPHFFESETVTSWVDSLMNGLKTAAIIISVGLIAFGLIKLFVGKSSTHITVQSGDAEKKDRKK